jgi:hypothetical protein
LDVAKIVTGGFGFPGMHETTDDKKYDHCLNQYTPE